MNIKKINRNPLYFDFGARLEMVGYKLSRIARKHKCECFIRYDKIAAQLLIAVYGKFGERGIAIKEEDLLKRIPTDEYERLIEIMCTAEKWGD